MKAIFVSLAFLVLASEPALAQSTGPMHQGGSIQNPMQMQKQMPMAGNAAPTTAEAEVRKIDREAGKITLKHGPIRNLDMPPMTMVFGVRDRALLDKVKVGEKVRFAAEQNAGALVVTAIEPAK